MTTRKATERDISAITRLLRDYRREGGREVEPGEVERLAGVLAEAVDAPASVLLVSSQDDGVLGYAAMHVTPFPLRIGYEAYISDLIVKQDARGSGVGSTLLATAEKLARKRGCIRIMLNTGKTSEAYMREFYPKQGLEERTGSGNSVKALE